MNKLYLANDRRWSMVLVALAFGLGGCKQQTQTVKGSANLPFYTTADFTPQWLDETQRRAESIHRIPSFMLVDQDGEHITEKTFEHKIYVADFFFTSCPGICKTLMTNLKFIQTAFALDSNVLILSHSVTPDIDSVGRLNNYAVRMGIKSGKWYLATGDKKEIYTIARQAYFADEMLGEKRSENDFLHTENVLLIDKHRRIRGIYKGTSVMQVKNLIEDIKLLETED